MHLPSRQLFVYFFWNLYSDFLQLNRTARFELLPIIFFDFEYASINNREQKLC